MAPNISRVNSLASFRIEEVDIDKKSIFDTKTTPLLSNEVSSKSNQYSKVSAFQEFTKLFEQIELTKNIENSETLECNAEDYWGWHNDDTSEQLKSKIHEALLHDVKEKNEIRDMLSIDAIEENLELNVKNDNEASDALTNNIEYWENPSDQDRRILLTSSVRLEEGLVAASNIMHQSDDSKEPLGYDSYWDWRNGESAFDRERQGIEALRDNLILEGDSRDLFSINTIERHLKENRVHQKDVAISDTNDNLDYWGWQPLCKVHDE